MARRAIFLFQFKIQKDVQNWLEHPFSNIPRMFLEECILGNIIPNNIFLAISHQDMEFKNKNCLCQVKNLQICPKALSSNALN